MDSRKAPSRNTWVGDIIVPDLRPGRSTLVEAGSRSLHLRMLFSTMPVPGTAKPEPNGAPSVCVTETTRPSASAQAKCVVCSFSNFAGWPSAIWPASFSGLKRSPSLTAARLASMRARWAAAYALLSSPLIGAASP
jgi:hypothetical protein